MGSSTAPTTPGSERHRLLYIPVLLWMRLVLGLRRRGAGRRESGAFLLGLRGPRYDKVKAFALYDDLDPHALDRGIVVMDGTGYAALWKLCRERRLEVLGDIHTHAGPGPRQSEANRTNPMIPEPGHMAFILPHFAGTWGWQFNDVAIYEYAGDYRWNDWAGPRRRERVRFCLW
jgi:hypothetical protein